jgi:hypothetical protein
MTVDLGGIRFDQIYGDNSGGAEFDTDRDGTATQEDEFVSFTNSTESAIDVSGWQIWSDMTGSNAPDGPQDGLYHTFPPGTVINPGQTLFIINEITGTPPNWAQEASEGGVESGEGGANTNFLTEGGSGSFDEAIALVDPSTGDYIVLNMGDVPNDMSGVSGFPGTTKVGEVDGQAVQDDQNAGSSYKYNSGTGQYEYTAVSTPCFVAGTLIETALGPREIETLRLGDKIRTLDNGNQPIKWIGKRVIDLTNPDNMHLKPIYVGRLGVSPQHRLVLQNNTLAPSKGLLHLPHVTQDKHARMVVYYHLLLPQHDIIFAEGRATESLLPGPTFLASCRISERLTIARLGLQNIKPARKCLTVSQTRKITGSNSVLKNAD